MIDVFPLNREEIEKQKAKERYMKMHLAGKTEQAKADLARLAIIRKQREEAARKKEEERKGERIINHILLRLPCHGCSAKRHNAMCHTSPISACVVLLSSAPLSKTRLSCFPLIKFLLYKQELGHWSRGREKGIALHIQLVPSLPGSAGSSLGVW